MKSIFPFVLFLLLLNSAKAQNADYAVYQLLKKDFTGSVLYTEGSDTLVQKKVGFQDVSSGEPIENQTQFELNEISQTFTAYIVLKLVEQNKLRLDESINTYLPELSSSKITILHLLNHQSGLQDVELSSTKTKSINTFILEQLSIPVLFDVGSSTRYASTNYVILAQVLEHITQKSYADLIKEFVTEPLKLKHTSVKSSDTFQLYQAVGHVQDIKKQLNPIESTFPKAQMGITSVLSNADDLKTWISFYSSYLNKKKLIQISTSEIAVFQFGFVVSRIQPKAAHKLVSKGIELDATVEPIVFISAYGESKGFQSLVTLSNMDQKIGVILANSDALSVFEIDEKIRSIFRKV